MQHLLILNILWFILMLLDAWFSFWNPHITIYFLTEKVIIISSCAQGKSHKVDLQCTGKLLPDVPVIGWICFSVFSVNETAAASVHIHTTTHLIWYCFPPQIWPFLFVVETYEWILQNTREEIDFVMCSKNWIITSQQAQTESQQTKTTKMCLCLSQWM